MKIKNEYGEDIDFVIEGNQASGTTIIFVHGFGTNKDEGLNLFVDLSKPLQKEYRIIRFDFSGYGQSGGRQEEGNLQKQTKDLKAILDYTRTKFNGKTSIIAMSLGCYVTAVLSPDGIGKTIFVSPPDSSTSNTIERLKKRIESRPGGKVIEEGISVYPRSSGEVQKIGPTFWKVLMDLDPEKAVKLYSKKTKLTVLIPLQDEQVERKRTSLYKGLTGVDCINLNGDHAFTNPADRKILVETIDEILKI
jgi:pimeloyl-ACP methyl ester carboxylesterase